jgi:dihydroorotase (multifunctional complex type)
MGVQRFDMVIAGGTAVLPAAGATRADIGIRGGRIVAIANELDRAVADRVIDARGRLVLPGAVDAHFHIGIYRPFDVDAESETRSALVGGVTSVLSYVRTGKDYLNRVGPYREIFPEVLAAVSGHAYTDYGFHVAIMTRAQMDEVDWLVGQGVTSFKYYMFYKALNLAANSTDAASYTLADEYDLGHLYLYMRAVAAAQRAHPEGRISLGIHCENAEIMRVFIEQAMRDGTHDLRTYSRARPPLSEELAVAEAGVLAADTGCNVNFLHLSSARALAAVDRVRRAHPELDLRAETTLHHIGLTYDSAAGGTNSKVNPPIRDRDDVEALWRAIARGDIDQVVSDHASIDAEKPDDLWQARAGFGGTALVYPILLSEGWRRRGLPLERVVALASAQPARAFGLAPRKGALAVGADADVAIVDPETERAVTAADLLSAQPFTPFEGMRLVGWPQTTIVRGEVAFANGRVEGAPRGEYLHRPVAAAAATDTPA